MKILSQLRSLESEELQAARGLGETSSLFLLAGPPDFLRKNFDILKVKLRFAMLKVSIPLAGCFLLRFV